MKILILSLISVLTSYCAYGQETNVFPANGNVGIGTGTPTEKLVVKGNVGVVAGGSFNVLSSNNAVWANNKILSHGYSDQDFAELLVPGYGANNASLRLNANGYVGIGTTSPLSKLDIRGVLHVVTPAFEGYMAGQGSYIGWNKSGGGGEVNFVNNIGGGTGGFAFDHTTDGVLFSRLVTIVGNGNMGIGKSNPEFKLDVIGQINVSGQSGGYTTGDIPKISFGGGDTEFTELKLPFGGPLEYKTYHGHVFKTYGGNNVAVERMRIDINGNIGVGTSSPDSKLSVNGNIRAREIKVQNVNWPDYVFAKDYTLPSLAETEKHIKNKGHLPGIPSAKEVEVNGINLGEMNAKLLQKIEELTLYLIQQNDRMYLLEKTTEDYKREVMELKSKLK